MAAIAVIDDEKKPTEVKLFNRWSFDEVQVEIVIFFLVFQWKSSEQSCCMCHLVRSVGSFEFRISNLLLKILFLMMYI